MHLIYLILYQPVLSAISIYLLGALDELQHNQLLMEAMGDLMRRSYLAVRRSEQQAFAVQDIDFETRNYFYKF